MPNNAKLVFRPQHVTLNDSGGSGILGEIVHREILGPVVRYGVAVATSEILVEVLFSSRSMKEIGHPVRVSIDINQAQLLGT